jgi:hypothetical protein
MKQIVIMPGGFHPFHAGHYALYKSAVDAFPNADVYVAATNDQKARPFPFEIKEKLAKLAGVAPGRFVQVNSPFKAEEITRQYNPNEDVLIFVRSEKDKNESPKPGGTKKDGTPSYFQPWTGENLQPFSKHAYIGYLPTVTFGPGIRSATEIRNAWPNLNDRQKTAMVMSLYPVTQKNPKLASNVVQMLDIGMGGEVTESRMIVSETSEELQELSQVSRIVADYMSDYWKTYITNPDQAEHVEKLMGEPYDDSYGKSYYKILTPTVSLSAIPGLESFNSPGMQLAKKFITLGIASVRKPDQNDSYGFTAPAAGMYDPYSRIVIIDTNSVSNKKFLVNLISHEVQHGIDDLKSRKGVSVNTDNMDMDLTYHDAGNALQSKSSSPTDSKDKKFQNYLTSQHEVNARFTEVINDIKEYIEQNDISNIASEGLLYLVREAFKNHHMEQAFPNGIKDPRYKRLIGRVHLWLQKYHANRIQKSKGFKSLSEPEPELIESKKYK